MDSEKENKEKRSIFSYQGIDISICEFSNMVYVNCSQVSKHFKPAISTWLRHNDMIEEYCVSKGMKKNQVVRAFMWLCEDIALAYSKEVGEEFYEWLKVKISEFKNNEVVTVKLDDMEVQLTKSSTSNEIKDYFNAVLMLSKQKEEYPVNLDDVWPLVYTRRDSAIDALKRDFIENDDYITVRQNPQGGKLASEFTGASWGGNNKLDYHLTVSCLEYFIVKKVRPVFEVYRQVFHHTANNQKMVSSSPLVEVKTKIATADWLAKFLRLNDSSKLALAKTIADPLGLPTPDYTESKDQLLSATELLKRVGSSLTAQGFNMKMKAKGFITELERQSHKGVKKFKSLTDFGLQFGENQVNPNNPKETQPLYYAHRFDDLLSMLG